MSPARPEQSIPETEIKAAVAALSAPEAKASLKRERLFYQPKEALELREPQVTLEGERLPPTPEQVEEMDRRFVGLGEVLGGGSAIDWQIDGGLAISVYDGVYHGYHKDIDISIDRGDVTELQHRAGEHGYGLFVGDLYRDKDDHVEYALRPADTELFASDRHHRFMVKVDADGAIQTGGDLDFIDIHIRPLDVSGREFGTTSVTMPEAWKTTTTVEFRGAQLRLPPLAKIAYFKLYAARPVDLGDLRLIAQSEHFSRVEFTQVEQMLAAERQDKIASAKKTVDALGAEYSAAMTAQEVENFLVEDDGNWTREYSGDGLKKLGVLFHETAQHDIEMAKEQIVNAITNTLPHEREDRWAELQQYVRD